MSAILASWLPCLVLMPIGIWLTIKSMNDAALMNIDVWEANIKKVFSKISQIRKSKATPS